jgi:8-oxo-dGTP pyrophosphatase MutT (NUDIX family)
MDIEQLREKTNYVSITGIIRKDGKYLICKRSPNEKAFPNMWCVPGGKIEQKDFINTPKDTKDHWLDIFEKTLKKEILEETNLKIKNIGYVSSLVFIRPNGFSTIIVSLYADYDSGNIQLSNEELVDYSWVGLEEAKEYDLIENIYEQISAVDDKYRNKKI